MNRVWNKPWVISRNISTLSRKSDRVLSGKPVLPVIPKRGYGAPPRPLTDLPGKIFVPGVLCFYIAYMMSLSYIFPRGVKSTLILGVRTTP